ncbi:MAG TPA: hypothetical protein VM282_02145 [Acidimicrobiales bacterium]|nr:hypothetical protein [Acidimicrobiales bacterium]
MDRNVELPTALRRAAQQTGYEGSDALGWRELLENAADEIDRLRVVAAQRENARSEIETRR